MYLLRYVSLVVSNMHASLCFSLILLHDFVVVYFFQITICHATVCVFVQWLTCMAFLCAFLYVLSLCVCFSLCLCPFHCTCLCFCWLLCCAWFDVSFRRVDPLCLLHVYMLSAALRLLCFVLVFCSLRLFADCCSCSVIPHLLVLIWYFLRLHLTWFHCSLVYWGTFLYLIYISAWLNYSCCTMHSSMWYLSLSLYNILYWGLITRKSYDYLTMW